MYYLRQYAYTSGLKRYLGFSSIITTNQFEIRDLVIIKIIICLIWHAHL